MFFKLQHSLESTEKRVRGIPYYAQTGIVSWRLGVHNARGARGGRTGCTVTKTPANNGRPLYREVSTYETPKEEWPSVKYNRPGVVDF